MAAMRPLKAIALLGLPPLVASAPTCRNPTVVLTREIVAQCASYSTQAPPKSFSFRIAASYSGKGSRYEPRKDLFHFYPHTGQRPGRTSPLDRPNTGQDAFFVGDVGRSNDVAFGVADGVGGWTESGIDPADFSHGLCDHMRMTAAGAKDGTRVRPRDLLQTAYEATVVDEDIFAGGSTACVAVGREDGELEVAKYVGYLTG